jgi:hypothetical protein
MTNRNNQKENANRNFLPTDNIGDYFEIHIKGHLDQGWSDWLEGLAVETLDNGETRLSGYIRDQAALMGTLNKLYSLNLVLLSFTKVTRTNG